MQRETVVVEGPLAGKMQRYLAANERAIGREITTLPHLAARLAGGFFAAPGPDQLYPAIKSALEDGNFDTLRDVAALPGMPRAVLETLSKVWKADLDLSSVGSGAGRLTDLTEIERRVRAGLGAAWLVPPALRDAAISRARHAPTLLGSVRLREVLFVDPVWRPLILELCRHVEVTMHTSQPDQNEWFSGQILTQPLSPPAEQVVDSCADPRAEAIEALRWVRHQLAQGAEAADVAITSAATMNYDEHLLVMRGQGLSASVSLASASAFPEHILEDAELSGRMKVRLSEALARTMDESEWKKFSTLYGLASYITDHPRFLPSLSWDDPDHEGHVLDLVNHLFNSNPRAFNDLLERPNVLRWIKKNDRELLDLWEGDEDPLITALSHVVSDVSAVSDVIDLSEYTDRIQNALPGDPYLAIGATKDLLEATMRTILHRRGVEDVEKLDFPALSTRCLTELGLIGSTAPSTEGERHVRKIASSAKTMIETANSLRNLAGTGHGRVVGNGETVTAADASLVASSGLVLAAWLLRHQAAADE